MEGLVARKIGNFLGLTPVFGAGMRNFTRTDRENSFPHCIPLTISNIKNTFKLCHSIVFYQ